MNLQELKQNIRDEVDMSAIYSRIKCEAQAGESSTRFSHGYIDQEDEISEVQVAILRENGYTVEWNRACLWYEISGWSE
ncbi:hypothetical protein D3C71_1919200 [compost metagenome]